ncbi:MAG: flagellar protein export ATPase FliI [Deltaproteobacteria bacterium]|nr:flagellar protein export ATPase FliI [Deltaproteobacteria bacterium]
MSPNSQTRGHATWELPKVDFSRFAHNLSTVSTYSIKGKVTELTGLVVKAVVPGVRVGELCLIEPYQRQSPIKAEVVGFRDQEVLLMPLGGLEGIGLGNAVIPTGGCLKVRVGPQLLGRVLDGLGDPLDSETLGPLEYDQEYPVTATPPPALSRQRVTRTLATGVRAIDGMLTCGEGQRIGFFAAAGVGKSTILGMIARNTEAEVNVICLVGERGREVRDFVERDLGAEGLRRSVVIVSTSDEPSLVRLKAAYVATAIAEYFRDQGRKVLLMMDSITRFARALREVGLAVGEPPARQGYTPSVFSTLPRLLERAGNSDRGSITAFYTILVAGDDMNEPVADETRSILDGHIILSRAMAARNHYPAIDISESVSRVMDDVVDPEHCQAARKLREVVANYEKERDLILIGAYESGSDPKVDYAIEKIEEVNEFLKQGVDEHVEFSDTVERLRQLFE